MIRSSRWGGNRILLKNLPDQELTVFLYVWEDNNSETYDILVAGRVVQPVTRAAAQVIGIDSVPGMSPLPTVAC